MVRVDRNLLSSGQVVGGKRLRLEEALERALVHDSATFASGAGSEVDDPVGRAHHFLVVLDNDNGVAAVAESL